MLMTITWFISELFYDGLPSHIWNMISQVCLIVLVRIFRNVRGEMLGNGSHLCSKFRGKRSLFHKGMWVFLKIFNRCSPSIHQTNEVLFYCSFAKKIFIKAQFYKLLFLHQWWDDFIIFFIILLMWLIKLICSLLSGKILWSIMCIQKSAQTSNAQFNDSRQTHLVWLTVSQIKTQNAQWGILSV